MAVRTTGLQLSELFSATRIKLIVYVLCVLSEHYVQCNRLTVHKNVSHLEGQTSLLSSRVTLLSALLSI